MSKAIVEVQFLNGEIQEIRTANLPKQQANDVNDILQAHNSEVWKVQVGNGIKFARLHFSYLTNSVSLNLIDSFTIEIKTNDKPTNEV